MQKCSNHYGYFIVNVYQSLLCPYLFSKHFKIKKGEREVVFIVSLYGRFLIIINTSIANTMMIRTNKPAIAGTKYMSAVDCAGVAAGVAVGCSASTVNAVSACDGQYDSLPPNEA